MKTIRQKIEQKIEKALNLNPLLDRKLVVKPILNSIFPKYPKIFIELSEKYLNEEMAKKKCPRCGINELDPVDVRNSLSRKDNKTYICNKCGEFEATLDMTCAELEKTKPREAKAVRIFDAIWLESGIPLANPYTITLKI